MIFWRNRRLPLGWGRYCFLRRWRFVWTIGGHFFSFFLIPHGVGLGLGLIKSAFGNIDRQKLGMIVSFFVSHFFSSSLVVKI
ncbi:hypothetical protein QBC40DRAFT_275859 [Triangularia verruculosa]|uniref:Uncharacterized protein n=1 Tax=Triangularia verruculosa TaxID=2587418 RepID=A0AAN7AY08_9PEZI|nr:hypothetical protein QBC40DRAFT_275859 [Triangularia verruculosa]